MTNIRKRFRDGAEPAADVAAALNGLPTRELTVDEQAAVREALDAVRRITPTPRQMEALISARAELLLTHPFLASVSSSDSVFYHAVDTDLFPIAATDGIGIYLNARIGGFFESQRTPEEQARVHNIPSSSIPHALAPATPSAAHSSGKTGLTADERVFALAHEIMHVVREDCLWNHYAKEAGVVHVPRIPDDEPRGLGIHVSAPIHNLPPRYAGANSSSLHKPYGMSGFLGLPPPSLRTSNKPNVPLDGTATGTLPYDEEVMQIALDAIINSMLFCDGVGAMPEGVIAIPGINYRHTIGEAYAYVWRLFRDHQSNQKNRSQHQGQGQGQGQGQDPNQAIAQAVAQSIAKTAAEVMARNPLRGDVRAPGEMGDPTRDDDDGEGGDASTPIPARKAVAMLEDRRMDREIMVQRACAAARNAGVGSCAVQESVMASREPDVDWKAYIPAFLARAAQGANYDWTRPNRPALVRDLTVGQEPFFEPALSGQGAGHVVVVADTSGSISEREHRAILGALCGMMAAVRPKRVTVVFCDDKIQRVDTFDGEPDPDTCATLAVPKGGGTSFIPAIEWAVAVARGTTDAWGAADMPPPEALIYVTDLYGPAPPKAPTEFPVLWVSVSDAPHPWGERVTIDPDSLV